jgi:GT2 family glycosyltransferase
MISYTKMKQKGPDFEVKNVITTYSILTQLAMESATEKFLKTDCDWLLFIETDMSHPEDTVERLLRHNLPVVSGVQTWKVKPFTPMIYRYRPQVLWGVGEDTQEKTGPYQAVDEKELNGKLLQVDGVATGCLLVKREVFEKIERPWFSFTEGTQDFYFCRKVLAAGYPIYCDSSVQCGHFTTIQITLEEHRRYKAAYGGKKA